MRIIDTTNMLPGERLAEIRERNRLIRPSLLRHIQKLATQTDFLLTDSSRFDTKQEGAQRLSGPMDARNLRSADGNVSTYVEGALEQVTPQTRPATEELAAPQLGSQLRQEGAE